LRDPCSGLREGARNHLSAGSIEEGGRHAPTTRGADGVAELHRKRRREGRSEEGNDGEGGKREEKRGDGETKWKNLRFPARGETVRGEFVSVGVTLDKRRGLYVVLTPRFSTEKQPLSPTWKPPWTSVTTIAEEHIGGGRKDAACGASAGFSSS